MSDRPLFSVGEEVIYVTTVMCSYRSLFGFSWFTKRYAHKSGEGKIIDVGTCFEWPGELLYKLDTSPDWYTEASLRKKPKPSTQSFTELLQSIQQPERAEG